MKKLQAKEEKFSDGSEFLFALKFHNSFAINRIILHKGRLFVVPEVSRVDRFVLIIILRNDDLAEIEEAVESIDQEAIMGESAIICICESCSKFCPSHVGD